MTIDAFQTTRPFFHYNEPIFICTWSGTYSRRWQHGDAKCTYATTSFYDSTKERQWFDNPILKLLWLQEDGNRKWRRIFLLLEWWKVLEHCVCMHSWCWLFRLIICLTGERIKIRGFNNLSRFKAPRVFDTEWWTGFQYTSFRLKRCDSGDFRDLWYGRCLTMCKEWRKWHAIIKLVYLIKASLECRFNWSFVRWFINYRGFWWLVKCFKLSFIGYNWRCSNGIFALNADCFGSPQDVIREC